MRRIMVRFVRQTVKRTMPWALSILAAASLAAAAAAAEYRVSRGNDLFYNFYEGPALYAGGVSAGMYPSPLPVPPLVGHTYITYQPLMPHEFLYQHHRTYYRHHPGHGWVSTKIHWR